MNCGLARCETLRGPSLYRSQLCLRPLRWSLLSLSSLSNLHNENKILVTAPLQHRRMAMFHRKPVNPATLPNTTPGMGRSTER